MPGWRTLYATVDSIELVSTELIPCRDSRNSAFTALPSVIGGPGWGFTFVAQLPVFLKTSPNPPVPTTGGTILNPAPNGCK